LRIPLVEVDQDVVVIVGLTVAGVQCGGGLVHEHGVRYQLLQAGRRIQDLLKALRSRHEKKISYPIRVVRRLTIRHAGLRA
jgi:hypothetical protein